MKFYLYPRTEEEFNIMVDVAKSENVFYKIHTDRENIPFGYKETFGIIVNCDYEKLEFIKYIINKKYQEFQKLKVAWNKTCLMDRQSRAKEIENYVITENLKCSIEDFLAEKEKEGLIKRIEIGKIEVKPYENEEEYVSISSLIEKVNKRLNRLFKRFWGK